MQLNIFELDVYLLNLCKKKESTVANGTFLHLVKRSNAVYIDALQGVQWGEINPLRNVVGF